VPPLFVTLTSQLPFSVAAVHVQAPATQVCPPAHAWPQVPQLLLSVFVLVQPLQHAAPAAAPQLVPHARQLFLSVLRLASQPSGFRWSQSPKLALQVSPQVPVVQNGVAFAVPQTWAQAPQLFTSKLPLVSQPVVETQSRYPALHP
jgi:hypothetical protein